MGRVPGPVPAVLQGPAEMLLATTGPHTEVPGLWVPQEQNRERGRMFLGYPRRRACFDAHDLGRRIRVACQDCSVGFSFPSLCLARYPDRQCQRHSLGKWSGLDVDEVTANEAKWGEMQGLRMQMIYPTIQLVDYLKIPDLVKFLLSAAESGAAYFEPQQGGHLGEGAVVSRKGKNTRARVDGAAKESAKRISCCLGSR